MADVLNDTTVISKQNAGFPDYLDFTRLRSEGIGYLAQLSGKIWTDHNVHDPGITILETLCYALLDLGYRTNLPAVDLFTPAPGSGAKDSNFFTPAQILGCNPLTILDYRKMLVDIDGVRNAWLEVADDLNVQQFCGNYNDERNARVSLNGLYNVYIELEENVVEENVLAEVKKSLLAHRNFCEDFLKIYILCRQPLGVTADIELGNGADPEKTYLDLMQRLQQFFSPAPQFYTLPQLLDKGVSMDEAFAGRPYNVTSSHGFVDTTEFEQIILRKEIHTSDVYNVLLSTTGISRLQSLRIKFCDRDADERWKIFLPENHIPLLNPACCAFRFTRNGIPVAFDFSKYNDLLLVNFRYTGKITYQKEQLDAAIPTGVYRKDLADYYSIQNDFPRVYGIAKGGLSASAPAMRKAQALQLKGYLLFFDQLLANYLTQLQHIRTLFSMSAPEEQHTYFINGLDSVPDLDKLQRFSDGSLGNTGDTLCYPIDRSVIDTADLQTIDIGQLTPATFETTADNAIAIAQLEDDLRNNNATIHVITQKDGCCFYYITSSATDFVLISKRYYPDATSANNAATALLYMGTFDSNYNAFLYAANTRYSFEISFNLSNYSAYLQQIAEDENQYAARRQGFLDHLLSRFAEQFTDYALLSYGQEQDQVQAKENFLGNYSELSADRGTGYDYSQVIDISGFEQRFLALAGITDHARHTLCNFEVVQYAEQYLFTLPVGENDYFRSTRKYDTRAEAQEAAKSLLTQLGDQQNYSTEYLAHEQAYVIRANNAIFSVKQPSAETANTVINGLQRLYTTDIASDDVYIYTYRYNAILKDSAGNKVRMFIAPSPEEHQAHTVAVQEISKINDNTVWEDTEAASVPIGILAFDEKQATTFIDTEAFKIGDNDIIDKPDKMSYTLVEKKGNRFKFTPLAEFDNKEQVTVHAFRLLVLMLDTANYSIAQETDGDKYLLSVKDGETPMAVCAMETNSAAAAQALQDKIWRIVNEFRYDMSINQAPDTWKFNYTIGYHPSQKYTFISEQAYDTQPAALEAARKFTAALPQYKLNGGALTANKISSRLAEIRAGAAADRSAAVSAGTVGSAEVASDAPNEMAGDAPAEVSGEVRADSSINSLLNIRKHIDSLRSATDTKAYDEYVQVDEISQCGQYVYRLVDKDHPVAVYNGIIDARKQVIPDYLEIYPGGDIVVQDGKLFYYQIKSVNRNAPDKELVLYRSLTGYSSQEEALQAFKTDYLQVLQGRIVATPGMDAEAAAKLASTYPIKQLFKRADCDEFYRRFYPCDPNPCADIKSQCCFTEPDEAVYYFSLGDWQSVEYYSDPAAAMQGFRFFLILLQYAGNYTNTCDCNGVTRTYLREVLAESTTRFLTPDDAWGEQGVQLFINTGEFQRYSHSCAYSFFMGSSDQLIIHPCEYDDVAKRDAAKIALYNQYKKLAAKKSFVTSDENGNSILKDNNGVPFATVLQGRVCNWVDVIEALQNEKNIIASTKQNDYYLTNGNQQRLLTAYAAVNAIQFDTWKQQLLDVFQYYNSLIRLGEDKQYYINIPFLQDNNNADYSLSSDVCDRWLINNGFATYRDAVQKLLNILAMLGDYENYRGSFDCSCGPYGVTFYAPRYSCGCSTPDGQPNQQAVGLTAADGQPNQQMVGLTAAGEMLAWNPQLYTTSEMACEAVKRAQKLINREGLHVVEHILLRPHCENNCGCYLLPHQAELFRQCDFPDLVAGYDPYSFIATVVLPAWPERFRKDGNRQVIENMLQREAPAHVLLRITWLMPKEFCQFESYYKQWIRWMAKKTVCNGPFDFDGFLQVLTRDVETQDFQEQVNELFDWKTSCEEQGPVITVAAEGKVAVESTAKAVSAVTTSDKAVTEAATKPVTEDKTKPVSEAATKPVIENKTKPVSEAATKPVTEDETKPVPEAITKPVTEDETKPIPEAITKPVAIAEPKSVGQTTPLANIDASNKARIVNGRLNARKKAIKELAADIKDKQLAGMITTFSEAADPSLIQYQQVVDKIIADWPSGKKKILNKKQATSLLSLLTGNYLDKYTFGGKDISGLTAAKPILDQIKTKMSLADIYREWNAATVKKYEPSLDMTQIENLFK